MCSKFLKKKGAVKDKPVERVVFNAITRQRCSRRCSIPRKIDRRWSMPIWRGARSTIWSASRCRRCCGASCPGARSAGRVQSVALRLICDRELEIEAFKAQEYWTIEGDFATRQRRGVLGPPQAIDGKRLGKLDITNEASARAIEAALNGARFSVDSGREQAGQAPSLRRPSAPRRCSRKPRASSASPRPGPCRSPSASMKASTSAARRSASSPICEPTAFRWRGEAIAATRNAILKALRRALSAVGAAPIHDQGQERPGSPRGHPPDRPRCAFPSR